MSKRKNITGVVYSTNPDYKFQYDKPVENETLAPSAQDLRVYIEKHHRGGKTVSVIKGFIGRQNDLESLARMLKAKCGVGGTAKDNEILIQGDHRDKIVQLLSESGYRVKKAGG